MAMMINADTAESSSLALAIIPVPIQCSELTVRFIRLEM